MAMHNPPHPGEFILATYMEPFGLSCRYLSEQLDVAASTLNRVLKGQSGISPGELPKALERRKAAHRRVGWQCSMPMTYVLHARLSVSPRYPRSS